MQAHCIHTHIHIYIYVYIHIYIYASEHVFFNSPIMPQKIEQHEKQPIMYQKIKNVKNIYDASGNKQKK
jgi:hypothetical protein